MPWPARARRRSGSASRPPSGALRRCCRRPCRALPPDSPPGTFPMAPPVLAGHHRAMLLADVVATSAAVTATSSRRAKVEALARLLRQLEVEAEQPGGAD